MVIIERINEGYKLIKEDGEALDLERLNNLLVKRALKEFYPYYAGWTEVFEFKNNVQIVKISLRDKFNNTISLPKLDKINKLSIN